MNLLCLDSADTLCRYAGAWDDLWSRSEVVLPTLRAEIIAGWLWQFAPQTKFRALVVEDDGQFVAGLPLVGRRLKGLLEVGDLPNNAWSASGDLLLDPSCDVPRVLDQLVAAATVLRWPLLWFDGVPWQSARWQAWRDAADRAGLAVDIHPTYSIGTIETTADWEQYAAELPGDFRRNVRRRMRRLENLGTLELNVRTKADGLEDAVRQVFEVEHRCWKGTEGSSVLSHPGMLEFFVEQAERMAARGELAIYTLDLDGQPVAFEFGYQSGGHFFAHKVGYDEAHAKEGPGHVLRWLQLPQLFAADGFTTFDYFGKLTDAMRNWTTGSYELARLVTAPRRPFSRALMAAYAKLWPHVRRLRQGRREEPALETSA